MKAVYEKGKRFGRLIAITRHENKNAKNNRISYDCLCDCGLMTRVLVSNLRGGITKSCGCYRREVLHRRKMPDDVVRTSKMWHYYKRNAKLREVSWELTREEFKSLIISICKYCKYDKDWVGVDRVNNSLGYTVDNCVPCCRWCNWGKNERSLEEFKNWIERLYGNLLHIG